MQEAAMDASAASGYDIPRYESMGRQWLIRETDISYLRPLTYGDSVIVKTWVADFRRVRSRRAYELRHAETSEPIAQAHTDWVYLDTLSTRPVTIPSEMIAAFYPEGLPDEPALRDPFPEAPTPPGVFKMRRSVEWRDIDLAQHVNNATYMTYFEDCTIRDVVAHGWPVARIAAAGFRIVARRYRIEYKLPALMGDELEVTTWISDVNHSSAVRHFTITRIADQTLLARAYALWACVDRATGRPIRLESEFVAGLGSNMVEAHE
jgi:acyl-CoA thioester hydrolase